MKQGTTILKPIFYLIVGLVVAAALCIYFAPEISEIRESAAASISSPSSILTPLGDSLKEASQIILGFLKWSALVYGGVYFFYFQLWRSWRLLAACLSDDVGAATVKSFVALGYCSLYAVPSRSYFRAARIVCEVNCLSTGETTRFESRREWKNRIRGEIKKLSKFTPLNETHPVFNMDVFTLQNDLCASRMESYFRKLKTLNWVSGGDEFICHLRIKGGFISPLTLLAGTLNHFNQDWRKVIEDYPTVKGTMKPAAEDIITRFIFSCWLQWGPSIPNGTCQGWEGVPAYQYGYGDENNSFMILDDQALGDYNQFPTHLSHFVKNHCNKVVAVPYSPLCRVLRRSPEIEGRLSPIQKECIELADPSCIISHLSGVQCGTVPTYYSAYVWVLFVIGDHALEGKMKWKRMLPFFIHANIASEETFHVSKIALVRSATELLRELYAKYSFKESIHYACAFDDSGCCNPAIERSDSEPIKEVFKTVINEAPYASFKKKVRFDNFYGQNDNPFTACHLPAILKEYYEYLKEKKA